MSSTLRGDSGLSSKPHPYTPIGVDLGEKNLIAAAPADGDVDDALVIDGSTVRDLYAALVKSTQVLQEAAFDSTVGQAQVFATVWETIRTQVLDAAACTVRYAQQHPSPVLVVEELPYAERPLWECRMSPKCGTWLLPVLQAALEWKAVDAGIPVARVDPEFTSQECHQCGELGNLADNTVCCTNSACDVDRVCRDRSAALSIADRAR